MSDEQRLEVVKQGRPWGFDGDGHPFRLVPEHIVSGLHIFLIRCSRFLLASLNRVPHQITEVYDAILSGQTVALAELPLCRFSNAANPHSRLRSPLLFRVGSSPTPTVTCRDRQKPGGFETCGVCFIEDPLEITNPPVRDKSLQPRVLLELRFFSALVRS